MSTPTEEGPVDSGPIPAEPPPRVGEGDSITVGEEMPTPSTDPPPRPTYPWPVPEDHTE
ncbi:hypothetical protein [Streptomyces sp. NRRL S-1868]|uniref:hypothetical protein n=1 Tax=Streptomyces sp. NRRL S-1868 TaxID=1463892 RepID=UPI000A45FB0F|nr:hypothetical protein [Streptomyces sp. NRRL S-1868]